ncbi:hypothetical protein [Negadavirga shengliensis]|uniref:Uncharacterized protein n=1 Tax=Negadavirga shengliensis TaxID=1389218 RepID=A0ABV9SVQ3_9BACT
MDLEKFKKLKANYDKLMELANRAVPSGEFANQSKSVWFDRQSIEKLLAQTDEKTGGLKIFFGVYDESTAADIQSSRPGKESIGKLTVILTASDENKSTDLPDRIMNGGKTCPPDC